MGAVTPAVLLAAALLIPDATARAQSLTDRVTGSGDGVTEFRFEARPGVYGDGDNIFTRSDDDDASWTSRQAGEPGPVRVMVTVRRGVVERLKTRVGGRPGRADHDLGMIPVPEATAYLLNLAATAEEDVAEAAILPATLGDGAEVWPDLLRIGRDRTRPGEVRRSAVFWVGQAAGRAAAQGLNDLIDQNDEDLEIRKEAVLALSQRSGDECVPVLTRIATENPSPEIRKTALFWLAQQDDPRVLDLFEKILLHH